MYKQLGQTNKYKQGTLKKRNDKYPNHWISKKLKIETRRE